MPRWWRFCILFFVFGSPLPVEAEPKSLRRVLMVYSFARDSAPFSEVAGGFRAELVLRSSHPIEFVEASLHSIQMGDFLEGDLLVDFLRGSFREKPPALIVPVGAPAAQFVQANRARLFSEDCSVLVIGADRRRVETMVAEGGVAAVSIELDLGGLLEDMTRVRPLAEDVYFATGGTPLEQYWEEAALSVWRGLRPDIRFHSLSDQPVARMTRTVRSLPPRSIVFAGIMDRDAGGISHEQNTALTKIHRFSNSPVFGYASQQLGLGIVGGRLINMRKAGQLAAAAAVRLLDGAAPEELRVDPVKPGAPVYDWRELKRWDISETLLPPESTLLFRPPGFWEAHRWVILIAGFVGMIQSGLIFLLVAARKRTRIMNENFSLAAEAAGVGLWDADLELREIEASPRWRRLFDFPAAGRITYADLLAKIHPDDVLRFRQAIDQAVAGHQGYAIEHRILLAGGEERWIVSRGRAGKPRERLPPRVRGVANDITERKRAEEEIARQRAQLFHLSRVSSLGVLSGSIAHELNQPLGTILSNAQAARRMLSKDNPDLGELREVLGDIIDEDRRAAEIIHRMRTLLQRGEVVSQPVDVRECIDDVLRLCRLEIAGQGVSVSCDCPPGLPPVSADPVQLRQVFLNLLINARDAVQQSPPERKTVSIEARVDGDSVRMAVRDGGEGLPVDVEQIFRPLHTTKKQGLGLGLAICRAIIAAHGGKLWAEGLAEGGSAFHISLPRADSCT